MATKLPKLTPSEIKEWVDCVEAMNSSKGKGIKQRVNALFMNC